MHRLDATTEPRLFSDSPSETMRHDLFRIRSTFNVFLLP